MSEEPYFRYNDYNDWRQKLTKTELEIDRLRYQLDKKQCIVNAKFYICKQWEVSPLLENMVQLTNILSFQLIVYQFQWAQQNFWLVLSFELI